ncbi:protein DD3-3 [Aplysia californica]|uniref:Protein DD3-3 n=1 Tax=Aplysia californica TaxID=6500 RepID=A0ABM0JL43_APLCA|nr:protein DD3-3 [Aplysia californica]
MNGVTSSILCAVTILLHLADGDIYLHNPRGSNNRLDESSRARANGNNIFDSQNNERGGYNVGSLFYYQGSTLSVEWTNQHSCHDTNNHCELVLQYMCHDNIRDGVSTQTIPTNPALCANYNCDLDRKYRMHEDSSHYFQCLYRQRNKGIFTADQNMNNRERARNTRQNPAGTRRGYECPEERDYYPYWHPSPWVDIAVMTNDVSRCHYYRNESQNVKSKWDCVFPKAVMDKFKVNRVNVQLPNNEEDCKKFELPAKIKSDIRKPQWVEFPAHGVAAPDCRETDFTRDNHLGNGIGGYPNMFNWTIPNNVEHENCILRIRYNISTSDYDGWTANSSFNANPRRRNDGAKVPLADRFGFESEEIAKERGYIFKNNPVVNVFDGLDLDLRLAVNTAQFGRTFQDRSHTFAIRKRPDWLQGQTVHNLNVRGKRGNIVQVYPAVEYDFVPNDLEVAVGDYVHMQWTGSNTNPRNNDGQGLAGTDRNNLILLTAQKFAEGSGTADYRGAKHGHYGTNYPMRAENSTFLGLSQEDALTLAFLDPGQFRGEVSELDDAGTYFNLSPRKTTSAGTYQYMCTRNNNFSNRDQKGRVVVNASPFKREAIGQMGGEVALDNGAARMSVEENTFSSLKNVRLEKWSVSEGEAAMSRVNRALGAGDDYASDFVVLQPENLIEEGDDDKFFTLRIQLSDDSDDVDVYYAPSDFSAWSKADAHVGGGVATVRAQHGGVYVARSKSNVGMIVGVVIACVVVVVIVSGAVFYFRRNPTKWQAVKTNCRNAERSMKNKV